MTESPRPTKIPSILKKSNAKADDLLMPSDTMDSEGSPVPGKSQDNEYSDDITVLGNAKPRQSTDSAPSSAKKKFSKANNVNSKNQLAPPKDTSAGLKKTTLNTVKGAAKDLKGGKKATETVKGDMEDDIEDIGEEKENRKEVGKGGAQKKGKKTADVEESEEKQVESGDEEDGVGKKGNRKVKVIPSKNAKGTGKEKKESSPDKKSGKKEEEVKEEEEEEEKPKEVAKPKGKAKNLLGVKDNKENSNAVGKKSEEKKVVEKEKEKEKEEDEEESKTTTKGNGVKTDLLVRKKKKLLEPGMGKTVDKSADKNKEKDKKSDTNKKSDTSKKDVGTDKKKEVSSKKDKDKKDTDKKDKKKEKKKEKKENKENKEKKPKKGKKKEEEDREESEADDEEEEDEEDEINASKLSQLLDDDEEEEDDSGDEGDIRIFMRGADDSDDDIPKEKINADGDMEMISSKSNRSPVVDTYWKQNVRKSKGSSAKRKAGEMLNHQAYEADKILKMGKPTKVIMYSGLEQEDLDVLRTAVIALPEFTLNESSDPKMTHLIYNGTKRTMKLLYAIAKRAWILAPSFFYESVSAGGWIMEKECEFAGVKTKNFRDTYGPLFKDLRFYFNHGDLEYFQTINNPVNIEEIKKLVKLGGGKLVEKPEEAEVIIEDADNRKNSLAPKKFEGNQPHVISYKWVFDSLMQYTKLPYQEFNILM